MKPGITNRYNFKFKDGDKVILKPTPEQASQGVQIQTLKIITSGWTIRSNDYAFVYVCKNEEEALMTVPAINVDMQGELIKIPIEEHVASIIAMTPNLKKANEIQTHNGDEYEGA